MGEPSYGDCLRATAREHPDLFTDEELQDLDEWISEIEKDPKKRVFFEWLKLAADACILAAEK
ncbi:MAG: hypothetical protein AAF725_21615 [Acidobacteriota bacterium]